MQHRQARDHIHRAVQQLPAPRSQGADGTVERGGRQRQQQQPGEETHKNERALDHVGRDACHVKLHVEPGVGQQVHAGVEEHKQPHHAPQPQQRRPAQAHAQRRDRQHQHQEAQSPVTQRTDQGFGRVGPQAIGKGREHQPGKWQAGQHKRHRLGGTVAERAIGRPSGRRAALHADQYSLRRSMPA